MKPMQIFNIIYSFCGIYLMVSSAELFWIGAMAAILGSLGIIFYELELI